MSYEQSGQQTAERSNRVASKSVPQGTKSFVAYVASNRNLRNATNNVKFKAYNMYLKTQVDNETRRGILAGMPHGIADSSDLNASYDIWRDDLYLPDTEQTRQHFSGLAGNESWTFGRKSAIDIAPSAKTSRLSKSSMNKKEKQKIGKFGF